METGRPNEKYKLQETFADDFACLDTTIQALLLTNEYLGSCGINRLVLAHDTYYFVNQIRRCNTVSFIWKKFYVNIGRSFITHYNFYGLHLSHNWFQKFSDSYYSYCMFCWSFRIHIGTLSMSLFLKHSLALSLSNPI